MLIHKKQTEEFSLAADVDPNAGTPAADPNFVRTIFILGTIDPLVAARLMDAHMEIRQLGKDGERTIFHTNEQLYLFALAGIKGWSNFKDAHSNEVPFQVEEKTMFGQKIFVVKAEMLAAHLTLDEIVEIGAQVKKLVTLGVEETKN
jgi:hypothetical protein